MVLLSVSVPTMGHPMSDPLHTGERETYRHALQACRAFGGGTCTLLVLGTSHRRILLLHHAATDTAAALDHGEAGELADTLRAAIGRLEPSQ